MSDIVVIIPMYGFGELTDKCVELTRKNAGVDVDILVVDDGTPVPYRNQDADYVLRLDVNSGFTNAINQGILYTLKDNPYVKYIHMLNNDTEPELDFIKILLDVMENDENVGVAGSTKIIKREPLSIENFAVDMLFGYHDYTEEHMQEEFISCIWFGLTSALLRTSVIREIGIFDKRFKNHCSDNDFCFRVLMAGYKVILATKSRVFHIHEVTTRSQNLTTEEDGKRLLDKVRGVDLQRILDELPLDCSEGNWGRLHMEVYQK